MIEKGIQRMGRPVADIQAAIDAYIEQEPGCGADYIHGAYNAEQVAQRSGGTAVIMPLITKENLFSCVKSRGTLPRKSFSMGEGRDKRYYFEARLIDKEKNIYGAERSKEQK